jgi:hypothetical protein
MGENNNTGGKIVRRKVSEFKEETAIPSREQKKYDLNTPFGSIEKTDTPFVPNKEGSIFDVGKTDFGNPLSGNTMKCTGCGSNLFYDADSQTLICHSCGNIFNPATMEMNGSLGIKNPEQEYGIDDELDYEDSRNVEIVCNSCGSQIVTDAHTAATMCPFCGSPTLVSRRLTRQFRPDAIIPFSKTKEEAKKLYIEHISGIPHVPAAFKSNATIEKIAGVYVPFWLVSADVSMEIGGWTHTIVDGSRYYDREKQERLHTHSLDVPVDGNISFSLSNVPFDASKKISDRLMEACEPFNLEELVPYNASYLPGFLAEKYDAQPKDMYDRIKKRLDNYCHDVAEKVKFEGTDAFTYNSAYTGITYKNYKVTYCLLPIWFLNISYNDTNYQFAVNGQTGEVCGVIPESRFWINISNFAENLTNRIAMLQSGVKGTLYGLPPIMFGVCLGFLRTYRPGSGKTYLNVLIFLMFICFLSVIAFFVLPPVIVASERKRKEKLANKKNLHKLDKAPDVSFYYDTTKKLEVSKKLAKGGEYAISNPWATRENKPFSF